MPPLPQPHCPPGWQDPAHSSHGSEQSSLVLGLSWGLGKPACCGHHLLPALLGPQGCAGGA